MSEKKHFCKQNPVFATSAPSEGAQMRRTTMQTICAVKFRLAHLQHSKSLEKHEKRRNYLN